MKRMIFVLLLTMLITACCFAAADELSLPRELLVIGESAFEKGDALDRVTLKGATESILSRAFADSAIRSINLPRSIQYIAPDAFDGCHQLVATVYKDSYAHAYCEDQGIPYVFPSVQEMKSARDDMIQDLCGIVSAFTDANDFIPAEAAESAIDAVEARLREEYARGTVTDYAREENGVRFTDAAESIYWVWSPRVEGLLSSDDTVRMSIRTYQPFYDDQADFRTNPANGPAQDTDDSFDYITYLGDVREEDVTLDAIRGIGVNQLVIWYGHGGFSSQKPYLATGMTYYDLTEVEKKLQLSMVDNMAEIIVKTVLEKEGITRVCVTPGFIAAECTNMDHSVIWLNACHSGQTEALAKAFLDHGAAAVIGYSDTVGIRYAGYITKLALENMRKIETGTGKHYTLKKALDKAKADAILSPFANYFPGKAVIFTQREEENHYSLWNGTLSGTVYEKREDDKKIPAGGVAVRLQNEQYDGITLTVTTNENGQFQAHVPAGTYSVQLSGDAYITTVPEGTPVAMIAEETNSPIWYIPKAGILRGTLRSSYKDAPLVGARIICGAKRVYTDENGSFELKMPRESAEVTFSAENHKTETRSVAIPSGEVRTLDLQLQAENGTLSGNILDAETNERILEPRLTLLDADGQTVDLKSVNAQAANGWYAMLLPPGAYTLTVSAEKYSAESVELTVEPGDALSRHFSLRKTECTLSGRVTDIDTGEAIGGATVTLTSDSEVFRGVSGADGAYQINAKRGSYRITAQKTDYKQEIPLSVTLTPDLEARQDIEMARYFRVSFNTGTDQQIEEQSVRRGGRASDPGTPTPESEYLVFKGWRSSLDGSKWDFSRILEENMVLSAWWDSNYELRYESVSDKDAYQVSGYRGTPVYVEVPETYEGKPVVAIGENAFANCKSLQGIIFPDAVTEVKKRAFYNCTSLISVSMSSGVMTIGEGAFDGCACLRSAALPASVTSIGAYAFRGCGLLEELLLPASLREIWPWAFANCASLTHMEIPEGVTSLSGHIFSGCTKLASVTLPESLTTLSLYVFEGCDSLYTLQIPSGLQEIGQWAFAKSGLTEITIPENIRYIRYFAFSECANLKQIVIPESVTALESSAFSYCTSLTYASLPGTVSKIGISLFEGCESLASVQLPDSINSVENDAFNGCRSLTGISLPEVSHIANNAFKDCESLVSVSISQFCSEIDSGAFSGCSSLRSIALPRNLQYLSSEAFMGCTSLQSVDLSGLAIGSIGDNAFSGCSALESVSLPQWIRSIGGRSFYGCQSLQSISIPEQVGSIGFETFAGCNALKEITLPDAVTLIDNYAFANCAALERLTIPASVSYIGLGIVDGSGALRQVSVAAGSEAETYFAENYPEITRIAQ